MKQHGTVHLGCGAVTLRIAGSALDPLLDALAYAVAVSRRRPFAASGDSLI